MLPPEEKVTENSLIDAVSLSRKDVGRYMASAPAEAPDNLPKPTSKKSSGSVPSKKKKSSTVDRLDSITKKMEKKNL